MKSLRIISMTSFFMLLFAGAYAQAELTPKQSKEFEKQKLVVLLDYVGVKNQIDPSTWKKWTPIQSMGKITEAEFYTLSGNTDLAGKASARKGFEYLGLGAGVLGTGVFFAGLSDAEDWEFTTSFVGAGIAVGGVVMYVVAKIINKPKLVTFEVASEMASEYNRQLAIKIKLEF